MHQNSDRREKYRVVYIVGSGHSGSTFIESILATFPGTLGLGEVLKLSSTTLWNERMPRCSCGRSVEECSVWREMKPEEGISREEWYASILERVRLTDPGIHTIIDSSKRLAGIAPWRALADRGLISEVKVILLVRDVRGWIVSQQKNNIRKEKKNRSRYVLAISWWRSQNRYLKFIRNQGLPYTILNYENSVFNLPRFLDRFQNFIFSEIPGKRVIAKRKESNIHNVYGNRMKDDRKNRSIITYDYDWMKCYATNLTVMVFYPVWRFNKRIIEGTMT